MELSSSKIKKFLIFQEMELSSSNIKKSLIFSQKKAFLIFREMKLSYILGNRNPEKILYISENNFPGSKNEKTHSLYIRKWKKFLYSRITADFVCSERIFQT